MHNNSPTPPYKDDGIIAAKLKYARVCAGVYIPLIFSQCFPYSSYVTKLGATYCHITRRNCFKHSHIYSNQRRLGVVDLKSQKLATKYSRLDFFAIYKGVNELCECHELDQLMDLLLALVCVLMTVVS